MTPLFATGWFFCTLPLLWGGGDETDFLKITIHVQGTLLSHEFVDIDGDDKLDLILAIRSPEDGKRTLQIHKLDDHGVYGDKPDTVVNVLDDVVVWGVADVRADPGKELLFLTRTGAWSFSPLTTNYKDNIRRLARVDLIFDIPSPDIFPFWRFVIPGPAGQDLVFLPSLSAISLWGPRDNTDASDGDYNLWADFDKSNSQKTHVLDTGARVSLASTELNLRGSHEWDEAFVNDDFTLFSSLLASEIDYRAPALVDVNGDGLNDLLLYADSSIHVHLATERGVSEVPSRIEAMPDYLRREGDRKLRLADLDGDGDMDLLASLTEEDTGLSSAVTRYFILLNDGKVLFPEKPQQTLKLEAHHLLEDVADMNGDGRPDLVITKYALPGLANLLRGLELTRSTLLFLAEEKRPFATKATLLDEQTFDIDSLEDAIVRRTIRYDLSGDHVVDLVEADLNGHAVVRRIRLESSFFSGDSWELEQRPWQLFNMPGTIVDLEVIDANNDGRGDLVSQVSDRIELRLSTVQHP
ncbi:MAG: FG-GAP-like repeat-containing protein [Planctomycetota bacterium]|nr:FG-GAP-like repeat-containing protein [Planctomycetota bacterium]